MQYAIRVLIAAQVRFYRDGLADIISRHPHCNVAGTASSRREAVERVREVIPDIMLLDAAMPEGLAAAAEIVACAPTVKVVAIALDETPHAVLEWAEVGVSGYVPRDASLSDLIASIERTARGELQCSAEVAAGMIRRVWALAKVAGDRQTGGPVHLTPREREIMRLIDQGMTNKDIARHLGIGVAPSDWAGLSGTLRQLLVEHPRLTIIGIANDGRSGYVYRLQPRGVVINDISPRSLAHTIRSTVAPEDVHPTLHPFSAE